MPPIFTGNGDDGYTGYLGEGRLPKHDLRIEALGDLDESSAALGLAKSTSTGEETREVISTIQRDLYQIMAEVAAAPENRARFHWEGNHRVVWLEQLISQWSSTLRVPSEFIVPGDTLASAALALSRSVVRRAERRLAELLHRGDVNNPDILPYLNRLSSFCFLLELAAAQNSPHGSATLVKEDPPA